MDRRCRNWAIVIGINQYDNLSDLKYAKTDAEAVQKFFLDTVGFEQVFLFTDDSPPITEVNPPISTQPTFGRLRRFLQEQFKTPLLDSGDNLWFFFAGHGVRHTDRDYLMLADSDPGDVEHTALFVNWIIERLRRWNADNVMLFLDACRNEGSRDGLGIGLEKYRGVITFYSCSAREKAWEIEELQRGSFTHVLLEALQLQGERNCSTVARLDEYLKRRIPEINQRYNKQKQNPYASAEPATKLNLPILPRFITPYPSDLSTLKLDAYRAENQQRWDEAMGLWIRVNMAASGTDGDAIDAFGRIREYLKQTLASISSKETTSPRKINPIIIKPEPIISRAYWLFQGNPKYYRMLDAIRDLDGMPWPLKRYKTIINVGDQIIIWVSGNAAGIYAFGEISQPIQIFEEITDIAYWIDTDILSTLRNQPGPYIHFTAKFSERPLLRENLRKDPILSNLPIFLNARGSIFKITPEQWERVHELMHNTL